MRVLALASTFPRWANDTEPPFVFLLCKELAKSHEVTVLVPHAPGAKYRENMGGIEVRRFPYFLSQYEKLCYGGGILANIKKNKWVTFQIPFFFLMQFLFFLYLLWHKRPDVVHAHWAIPQGLTVGFSKLFYRFRDVLSIHGSDVFAFRKSRLKNLIAKAALRADFVTVNSSATKKILEHNFGVLHSKIVPMGVDLNKYYPAKSKDEASMKILCVGRLVEQKGFQFMIQAMPAILQDFPQATLTIVGNGPYREYLVQQAEQLLVSGSVNFVGAVSQQVLPDYYHSADYFIGASIMADDGSVEAFGVVFLESLASGLPTVATKVGGIADIIKHKFNGILVEQKNPTQIYEAIKFLHKNPQQKKKMVENGIAWVEEFFSWPKIAQEFTQIYEEIK